MEIPGFKLYRKDGAVVNNKKGGGVALYVKNSLHVTECDNLNSKLSESHICHVHLINFLYCLTFMLPTSLARNTNIDILQTKGVGKPRKMSVMCLGWPIFQKAILQANDQSRVNRTLTEF